MSQHKHQAAIVAWAEGKPIQYQSGDYSWDEWTDWPPRGSELMSPPFNAINYEFRVTPEIVTGWVNFYKDDELGTCLAGRRLYSSQKSAQDEGSQSSKYAGAVKIQFQRN